MKNKKIIPLPAVASLAKRLKKKGKNVVFTNGCFDVLHAGHLKVFRKAKSFGDVLIVGLNSDGSVRRLKGSKRPILNQADRAELISGMEPVDFVVIFSEDTPAKLIEAIKPDVLVKGGDWKKGQIVGAESAGRVKRIPLLRGRSTTKMIEKIVRAYGKKKN